MTALPSVTSLDLAKVQAQIERHLEKRSRVLDRSTQLAIAPAAREKSRLKGDAAWPHTPMPSDPPIIQMLLYLSGELENGAWKTSTPIKWPSPPARRTRMRLMRT
jgi:hypothetical protein